MAKISELITKLQVIQEQFFVKFGVNDVISNSKIYEVLIANALDHDLIPGHSGSRDAKDSEGEYEYKHYKESSSNHTWTFNDYSNSTIRKLFTIKAVIFAHIQDKDLTIPNFDWYYEVPGKVIGQFLKDKTPIIKNNRKMLNVSSKQVENFMGIRKSTALIDSKGKYTGWLKKIFDLARKFENATGTKGVLTSNKIWEVLVAAEFDHTVLSEQSAHDAVDKEGNYYEYKVSKTLNWNFQDISNAVLKKYLRDKAILMAKINKQNMTIEKVYYMDSPKAVRMLRRLLKLKKAGYKLIGKELRRLQVSVGPRIIKLSGAKLIYEAGTKESG